MNIDPPDDKQYFDYAKRLQAQMLWGMPLTRVVRPRRPQGDTATLTDEEDAMIDRELAYFGWCVRNHREGG